MEENKKKEPKAYSGNIPVYCAFDKIVGVGDIRPNPNNPNKHPENQIELLANIIEKQDWRQPIKVSTLSGYVVSGHGRYEAALFMGAEYVPVDYQDYENEEQELADLLADNRIAEIAEIDEKLLAELFSKIDTDSIEVELTGYKPEEYERITGLLVNSIEEDGKKEYVDLSDKVEHIHEVIVECNNEYEQQQAYERLTGEGYRCRVLTL